MFLTKLFVAYTVLASLCKMTASFGFGSVDWWFVFLPLFLALCEPAWFMYLAWREGPDDEDDDPQWPPHAKNA